MLSQFLINRITKISREGRYAKFKYYLFYFIRLLILKVHNPIIRYKIGNYYLNIPLSSDFPFTHYRHFYYSLNVGRIASQVKDKYKNLTFIDIGGFIGDTVAILRGESKFPVLSLEGDKNYYRLLQKNMEKFSEVEIINSFVNDTNELSKKNINNNSRYIRQSKTLTNIVKENIKFSRSKMLKVDTDGHDARVLIGGFEYLKEIKPVIFFEYDPDLLAINGNDGLTLLNSLEALGYENALIFENNGLFLLSAELNNKKLFKELHYYLSGFKGYKYFDICLFHQEDQDLFEKIRESEIEYFKKIQYVSHF
ncbi:MAG: FkbM family methyltransferase [Acidobacteriota bacterium]